MIDKKHSSEYLDNLSNQTRGLGIKRRILEFSLSCDADPQKLEVWNYFKVFFEHTEECFRTDIIVRLHSLFDPRRSSTRSLVHYLNETKNYLPGIMGKTIQDPEIASLRKHIDSQLTRAEGFQPTLKSLKHARDEYYAHFGEKYFDKPEALLSDKPLPTDDVVELVDFCREVVNWHTVNVFHCIEPDWLEDDGKDELELLFCFVRRYFKMCDEVPKKLDSSELLKMITL